VDKGSNTGDYTVNLSGYWADGVKENITKDIVEWSLKMKEMKKNPYIPKHIYSDPELGVTLVEWEDGEKTKVTCDLNDEYSWEGGYYAALAIKVVADGKKADMKNKWLPIISRRVTEMGEKIVPFPYGKWEDEQKTRKEFKKALKEELKKQAEEEEAKNVKNAKKAKGGKGK
jgi:hypothetical protein